MQAEQQVPDRWMELPPGPELAAALADLGTAPDSIDLLIACARQLAHHQAQLYTALVAVAYAVTAENQREKALVHDWPGDEIAAALHWTSGKAARELHTAEWLVERLPAVLTELAAGRIDHSRAATFVDVLGQAELTDTQLHRICDIVVPVAPTLTSGQLRRRLLRLIIAIDPGYAARRYRTALRERGVHGYLDRDGTATITATGLGTDEAVAACERLEHLADAVRHAGHPATLPQIRADLFTRLLDGRFDAMTHQQMISAMLADATHPDNDAETVTEPNGASGTWSDTPTGDPDADPFGKADPFGGTDHTNGEATETTDDTAAHGPRHANGKAAITEDTDGYDDADGEGSTEAGRAADPSDTGDTDPGDTDPGDSDPSSAAPSSAAPSSAAPSADTDGQATAAPGPDSDPSGHAAPIAPAPRPRRGGEIRVGLGTLMHRDEHPGEIPGWGPVLADIARAMTSRQHRAEWRFAVTDTDGYLVLAGITRRRPHLIPDPARPTIGGVVEIHVPAALLAGLATEPGPCSPWAGVIADIADQYTRRHHHQRTLDARPHDRLACAALRRHVQVRDRTCVAPGCRRPARRCDTDHTLDHDLGGLTTAGNSGPLCRRHHRMKHTGGWHLHQPHPGHFTWTSPLHRTYRTRGEPISPPTPDPTFRAADPHPEDDDPPPDDQRRYPILFRPPPEPPPPPPPLRDLDDEPPF